MCRLSRNRKQLADWAAGGAGWQPAGVWRVGLAALGIVPISLCCASSLHELRSVLSGRIAKVRVRRARQLPVTTYLPAGVLACVAGALNRWGPLLILLRLPACVICGKDVDGMDVETCSVADASQPANSRCRNRTQPGWSSLPWSRRSGSSRDSTRREVSFAPVSPGT